MKIEERTVKALAKVYICETCAAEFPTEYIARDHEKRCRRKHCTHSAFRPVFDLADRSYSGVSQFSVELCPIALRKCCRQCGEYLSEVPISRGAFSDIVEYFYDRLKTSYEEFNKKEDYHECFERMIIEKLLEASPTYPCTPNGDQKDPS